jgi:hypothetical protein
MTQRRHRDDAGGQARRSAGWLRFLVVAAIALPVAWLAGTQAAGMALTRFNPVMAVEAAPNNGQAAARLAELKLVSAVQAAGGEFPQSVAEPLWREARAAFLKAPLTVDSVRVAALTREEAGDEELARGLMRNLVQLSKRDLMSHLWLIGDYGRTGDLDGLLHHYDLALRTSSQAPDILLPRLALALQAPGAIDALTPVLARQPPWAPQFWRTIYVTPEVLPKATELRVALLEEGVPVPDDVDRRLMLSLGRDREWEIAEHLYRRVAGDEAPALDRIGEADLSRVPQLPPFEWNFPSTGLQSAEIHAQSGRMILSGGAGSSGVAATRIVALDPGEYEVRLEQVERQAGADATVAVDVTCVETVPHVRVARFRSEGGSLGGRFEIGAECRYHSVQVQLEVPRDSISGQVILDEIALRPV